jgi:(1->4)-alpha-D-glucan 1-alpha-D-glucosylmutase
MRIPIATYRVQLHKGFGFGPLHEILSYLSDLGISDVYASPIFKARKGSLHGYDVVAPGKLNPELGDPSEFENLVTDLKSRDMGWLQDIVPNHMAFDAENEMLRDVLENGARSPFLEHFDVWWDHPYTGMKGRLLAPFLGKFYGESLEEEEINLRFDKEGFTVVYYDLSFPLKIESYTRVLTHGLEGLKNRLGRNHPDFINLLGMLYVLKTLSSQDGDEDGYEQISFIKNTLWELYTRCEEIRNYIEENLFVFNGGMDSADRAKLLAPLLSEQMFRLSFWKVATEEINYRRFFSINDLISLRVEREEVFRRIHGFILKLVEEGSVTGLRVDHIDGLHDPKQYLHRLREGSKGMYTVVEKILEGEENLPIDWPVEGTTGYDFLNVLNGVFCRKENRRAFTKLYASFAGQRDDFEDLLTEKKSLILEKHMTGDIDNLALHLRDLSSKDRFGSDLTLHGLKRALSEVMVAFPVYRTYVASETVTKEDRDFIQRALKKARKKNPGLGHEFDFVERYLLLQIEEGLSQDERSERLAFVMRFQQFTGPLMAKGVEDTALYVYNRLLSLNEVGGNPQRFGFSLMEFHEANLKRFRQWPHALNATSTHDTKRGEEVRARINALSEIPELWEKQIREWSRINRKRKKKVGGVDVPDRNDEYFLYQTLIGAMPFEEDAFPDFVNRIKEYVIKAVREAKVHTAWLKPDEDYEKAYLSFVEGILEPGNPFLAAFLPFQNRVAQWAVYTGLSQALVKLTSPGVPDIYQGSDLWDLSLVDPDNRRPVNYEKRRAFLKDIRAKAEKARGELIAELLSTREDGRIKLYLIYVTLKVRKNNKALFREGGYVSLHTTGTLGDHVIAFARNEGKRWSVTVAPRFFVGLSDQGGHPLGEEVWKDTALVLPQEAPKKWENALTGEKIIGLRSIPLAEILRIFPAALLMSEDHG